MKNSLETSYFKLILKVLLPGLLVACSNKSNTDSPAPEGDLSPSVPSALVVSGEALLSESPTLSWTESIPQTGEIESYKVAIGSSEGADDVMAFTDVGLVTSIQISGSFDLGSEYYFTVYAVDTDARSSEPISSTVWSVAMVADQGAWREPGSPFYQASCSDYLSSPYYASEGDGVYWIDPDGVGGDDALKVYCDQTTDGGGWQLVTNYIHQGGTDPSHSLHTISLPLLGTSSFGQDGSVESEAWGHAATSMVDRLSPVEMRFYCTSSLHGKVIHFKSSHSASLNYITSGVGRMLGLPSDFTAYADHTAILPGGATSFGKDLGDDALIRFPFVISGAQHWSAGFGSRWECDDFAFNSDHDTIHQIWVR